MLLYSSEFKFIVRFIQIMLKFYYLLCQIHMNSCLLSFTE